ncbi:type II secretion system secretin GspD [Seleniivibrio woodruffii]|uniref:Type II secretion system protein D (GspD) n=1 Tax=Seleniivibrio woodruffii TaxID=1078050 RepID=A0A4R1KEI2_9BACT|nr:type II secretion system secretin GspD [Seleniivibrio woodruffii]TCK62403.1 type II secretion system protein D (GspD) [Seleniivibrio woodruffii]TVZ34479.1 general secretion pathway protein D [Seleniivibrio woodruffii]
MNLIRKFVLIILLFTVSTAAHAGFNVNFSDMDLTDFVTFVSEFTKKNFVYDKTALKGKVSIDSATQIRSSDIMDIFGSTLRANGFELIDRGKYFEIVKQADFMDADDSSGTGDDNALITTVIHPKNFDARVLVNAMNRMKSKGGYAEVIKSINAIVVRDRVSRIVKIRSFVDKLDQRAQNFTIRSIKIENASASNVADKMTKLFADMEKKSLIATDPVIVADDYANIILVASLDGDFERINLIVSQLDTKSPGSFNAPRVFYLKNANAEDVDKVLNTLTGTIAQAGTDGKTATRVKSSVSFDKATNSIIVFGDQELYGKVDELIKKLDVPRRQVYVEALILETTLDNGNKFGVEWQGTVGNGNTAGTIGFVNDNKLLSFANGDSTALDNGFNLGILGDVISYEGVNFPSIGLLVNFVKTASGINILSNPQILTLDNEEAEVFVGENRPFLTSTKYDSNNNPVQSYEYNDVGVKLKIVPQINSDESVTLKIEQEVKKVAEGSATSTSPITLTRSTKTRIKLKDGSMVVISGLLKDDSDRTDSAIPGLSKIPVLGWLFKNRSTNFQKTNMMVFISANIINTHEDAERLTENKHQESLDFKKQIDEKIRNEFK